MIGAVSIFRHPVYIDVSYVDIVEISRCLNVDTVQCFDKIVQMTLTPRAPLRNLGKWAGILKGHRNINPTL